MILILVVGYSNWGLSELAVLGGGPAILILFRMLLSIYYDWRLSNSDQVLKKLDQKMEQTISKMKEEVNYQTAESLLQRYGAGRHANELALSKASKSNIPHGFTPNQAENMPAFPPSSGSAGVLSHRPHSGYPNMNPMTGMESPNIPKWYDFILDALLGDDESHPKNRVVLICHKCRLINGRTPAGQTLYDIGEWRCIDCRARNGVEPDHTDNGREGSSVADASTPIVSLTSDSRPQSNDGVHSSDLDIPRSHSHSPHS